jgi:hypothetical protein
MTTTKPRRSPALCKDCNAPPTMGRRCMPCTLRNRERAAKAYRAKKAAGARWAR